MARSLSKFGCSGYRINMQFLYHLYLLKSAKVILISAGTNIYRIQTVLGVMKGDAQLNYLHAEISFSSMSQLSLLHNT